MSHHAVGQAGEARCWLKQAFDWMEKELANTDEPPGWDRRLTRKLLRTEANARIEDDESYAARQDAKP